MTKFLNVDLDIRLQQGLDELLEHLRKRMFVLHKEQDLAILEITGAVKLTLNDTLQEIAKSINLLPPEAKLLWDSCLLRKLDIGIQAAAQPQAAHFSISRKTAEQLLDLHVEIGLTIYAPEMPAGQNEGTPNP